ncbi:helix-turn-helix domain-containing protein [Pseudomonas sp. p1(2021b)]|uniref:helix-turn-helix domain-containing protein n=1 Tax=Pseudomonas sp. p1(2021b) TaxID=2874628 RepID=UPI001CD01F9E|nr:helix-turn-helix domain-containing protein [Pseudomonas sp. p1(2021b)]UBM27159.1 helix-turn-helix domain-containing protein [Pseudomonas sp. p1(2021b)]
MNPSAIIEALGGTFRVAELCEVRPPSVSEWKKNGIPRARLMFLRVVRPEAFRALEEKSHEEASPTMPVTIPATCHQNSSTDGAVNPSSSAQASP